MTKAELEKALAAANARIAELEGVAPEPQEAAMPPAPPVVVFVRLSTHGPIKSHRGRHIGHAQAGDVVRDASPETMRLSPHVHVAEAEWLGASEGRRWDCSAGEG
jgi:hypothetical protein